MDASDSLGHAVGSQQVAHPSMGTDDAERNATRGKLIAQLVQHLRAGQIEVGRRR